MIISYQWLLNYLPEALPINQLSSILTAIGLEVEAIEKVEKIKGSLEGLVIGEVITCEKHPNADKLKQTTVNIGAENLLKIVCGAPNVAAGQKVVVAPVGTTVHPISGDAFLIKKAKIRGEESKGMICAEDEIGLGNSHDGIMILPEDAPIGTLAAQYFNIQSADIAIHIGLTPNRSDAMSHIGVARDVCAYLSHHNGKNYSYKIPEVHLPEQVSSNPVHVNIEATEACPRYAGISISNVKVGPSPEWLQQYLNTIDVRSINNIVDITNFVLHEYGQPLHAFDADKIKGKQINVRFQPKGTVFQTLDSKEKKLNENDLMICDATDGMCIAGVFGGLTSGVSDQTQNLFLESAYFDAKHIRRTSMHHLLRTDAATHFEKGVDINNVIPALKRAAALICEIADGKIASEIIDIYPKPIEQTQVKVTYQYIHQLSGKHYGEKAIKNILEALGFVILEEDATSLNLLVPSNKTDVTQPADIVEEILRIDGLDNIEIPGRLNISLLPAKVNDRKQREKIAELLCGNGFQELVTNSIVNSKYYPERTDLIKMLNSLSNELDVMRPSMLESGLEVVQYNCNRKNNDLLLFEFGKAYFQEDDGYKEEVQLAMWITGNVQQANWNNQSKHSDLFYLKGIVQNIFKSLGVQAVSFSYEADTIIVKYKNQQLCQILTVADQKLTQLEIKQPVYFAFINWNLLIIAANANKIKYQEVPKFPSVQRDLAIIIDKEVSYQQVQQATEKLKLEALKDFDVFDVFVSEKIGNDKKSYALNYTFQLQDRTLTDAETEQLMQQLIKEYKTKLLAQIRE